jgi:hypothetical protein
MTNSMEQILVKKIMMTNRLLWNPKDCYHVYKDQPLNPGQMKPVHTISSYLFRIRFYPIVYY